MSKIKGELIKFKNCSGLILDGIYFSSKKNKDSVIIHIHGSFSNFYANDFINIMADVYVNSGYNFLSINLTQHDGIAEAIREINGESTWEYVGYSLSSFDTCIDDINGAIAFAKKVGNKRIILQGHSLGCNRIIHFCNCIQNAYEIILLSPTDSKNLQEKWIYPESIESQIVRLEKMNNKQTILYREHGVNTKGQLVDNIFDSIPYIPISPKSLLNLMKNPSFNFFNELAYTTPVSNVAFIYCGMEDEYQTHPIEEYSNLFKKYFSCTYFLVLQKGNHSFKNEELKVCNEIVSWLNNNQLKGIM